MFLKLDKNTMSVKTRNHTKHLTPTEFHILEFLLAHPNEIYNSDEIYRNVWKEEPFETNGMIAVHMRHIREKIEEDPSRPKFILSHWGKGYSFVKAV
ncbi:MAG: winged helix-turn-helix transcriptional regulator [Solobacterium sp.]|nr:winged helix-turn-helix transcriptional regulator [Solobacterium sp.]